MRSSRFSGIDALKVRPMERFRVCGG